MRALCTVESVMPLSARAAATMMPITTTERRPSSATTLSGTVGPHSIRNRNAAAATAKQRRLAGAEDEEILQQLQMADVEIVELDDAERQGFAEAVRPLIEAQRARFGDDLFQHLA